MKKGLAVFALLAAAAAFGVEEKVAPKVDASAHGGIRAEVDRPKPAYTLAERDPRIHRLPAFQALVDAAPAGSVLKPAAGSYAGPVRLTKPLTIDGGGQVVIDAGGKGTVFSLETDGAVLRGLALRGSGNSHDTDDACLDVRGHRNTIEALEISDCLFGIDLKQSNQNLVRHNRIVSKPVPLGVRGDALRLWYSRDNRVEYNDIADSRDMVAWYSHGNVISHNVSRRSRYSIHFMFATYNLVEHNRFYDNAVGVYLMYTEGVHIKHNLISHANGPTGMGIGLKEASDAVIEGNEIIYCAVGAHSDLSPFQPDTKIEFKNNRFAYNGIGIRFTAELGGNVATDNIFEGNLSHVVQSSGSTAGLNQWRGNYWDDYQGFDRNGDGVGDTPYQLYAFADRIWMEIPQARFFKSSPGMELLDFLERLAPFSTPDLILKDEAPRFLKPAKAQS
ncbi:putative ABC transporter binding protein NosD [Burkholderiales bacterium]|nr:putative ABC transporter binding protein NosD [Burkholderiales bacterium]